MRGWPALIVAALLQPVTWLGWTIVSDGGNAVVGLAILLVVVLSGWLSLRGIKVRAVAVLQDGFEAPQSIPGEAGVDTVVGRVWPVRAIHGAGVVFLLMHLTENNVRDWEPDGTQWGFMFLALLAQAALVIAPKRLHGLAK